MIPDTDALRDESPAAATPPAAPLGRRLRRLVLGASRDLEDQRLFHRLALVPLLAWVGLGADGLSSSAYGPEEAFKALGDHTALAVGLAVVTAGTVLLIAAAYARIIEEFPSGGGGYVVATKLIGRGPGVLSGSALLIDYVLTITISIAAAGDALFSFLPPAWHVAKLPVSFALILLLTVINLRGVRESVLILLPVFVLFLLTHALLIGGGILGRAGQVAETVTRVGAGFDQGLETVGLGGLVLLFLRAYALGGGTYTGIEAVSNGLPIMREPKVATGKRTMLYMGTSLAVTASGLLLCYLLWQIAPVPGKTMNAVLVERLAGGLPLGGVLVVLTLFSEAMLLVVAAQAGFIDGPRVLATMAVDSWVPHRFAALSERLTTRNGILVMGAAGMAALLSTAGDVGRLVVLYSINVFITFSLSMIAMLTLWGRRPKDHPRRRRRLALFGAGAVLCVTILCVTVAEKFTEGGWVTVTLTGALLAGCVLVRRHYRTVTAHVDDLYRELGDLPLAADGARGGAAPVPEREPVAAILVNAYGGVGIHTTLNVLRTFPGHFRGLVFLSVGVVDSGEFKGEGAVDDLRRRTEEMLARYVALAASLGVPAASRLTIGTDVVDEAERLCLATAGDFPRATFFAGKLIFQRERWWQRLLHNETALALQKRLQWAGRTMVTMPIRVRAA
jgi:amino acid transporter